MKTEKEQLVKDYEAEVDSLQKQIVKTSQQQESQNQSWKKERNQLQQEKNQENQTHGRPLSVVRELVKIAAVDITASGLRTFRQRVGRTVCNPRCRRHPS